MKRQICSRIRHLWTVLWTRRRTEYVGLSTIRIMTRCRQDFCPLCKGQPTFTPMLETRKERSAPMGIVRDHRLFLLIYLKVRNRWDHPITDDEILQ
mgnify:CR=1 FL=1